MDIGTRIKDKLRGWGSIIGIGTHIFIEFDNWNNGHNGGGNTAIISGVDIPSKSNAGYYYAHISAERLVEEQRTYELW